MCYRPNILVCKENSVIRKDGQKGTQRLKIIFRNSKEFKSYEYYIKENERLQKTNNYGETIKYKFIPCGKCKACRKQETQNWAIRIEQEAKQYQNNYFLTLTYRDEDIYIPDYTINKKTGEIFYNDGTWVGSLVKEDLKRFINSTRKWFERDYLWESMKFYACGEYGEIGDRPHYHIILMNTPPLELKPIGENKGIKTPYYTNERLEKIWGKGYINIGQVTWDSIAYTSGYCQKKLFGEVKEEYHASRGQIPIFANMSRRPGIGRNYFEENKEKIYECDEIINSKGKPIKPPSYFDRLMDIGEHDVMQNIKKIRETNANIRLKRKMSKTDKTILEQLEIEERTAIEKEKRYKKGRNLRNESIYRKAYTENM